MAAARAVSIPDIVLEIVEHVHAEPVSEHRPVLARLARVSHVFHDTVVRLLWVDLPNIYPLFKILSNCVSLHAPVNAGGNNAQAAQPLYLLALQGPTSNEDIARIRDYASLVRSLDFRRIGRPPHRSPRGITLEPQSLDNLLLQTGLPLLPSLTKLKLPVTPPYHSDPIFLICPSLRDLTISFPAWRLDRLTENVGMLFGDIFAQNALVTHLRVQTESYVSHDPVEEYHTPWMPDELDTDWLETNWMLEETTEESAQAFSDALAAVAMLNKLEVFSMLMLGAGVASRDLVMALSTLPQLRECSFGFDIAADILLTIPPGFANLRVLTILNVNYGSELRLFNSPHLLELNIYHSDGVDEGVYLLLSEDVGQRFSELHRLTWELGRRESNTVTNLLARMTQPLFALHDVRDLSIDVVDHYVVDDDIAVLAGGLPRLSHLELKFHMEKFIGPTARSLLSLAQGCASLHILHLGGLFINETEELAAEPYPFVGNHLKCLHITDLRCEGEVYAAMVIDLLFPFLDVGACRRGVLAAQRRTGQFSGVLDRLEVYQADRE